MNYRYAVAETDMTAGRSARLSGRPVNIAATGLAVAVMLAAAIELRLPIAGKPRADPSH
jgi:hypothetical protein